jgi:hypothetical protein
MLFLSKCLDKTGGKRTDGHAKREEGMRKTDVEIDELVYRSYGITESERKIIGNG